MANVSRFGLYAAVSSPIAEAMNVAQALLYRTVVINGSGRLRPDARWAGYRGSGNGWQAGEEGLWELCELKRIQWPI